MSHLNKRHRQLGDMLRQLYCGNTDILEGVENFLLLRIVTHS